MTKMTSSSNVDRLFALWQTVHQASYVSATTNPVGTFAEAPGAPISGDSGELAEPP